jgi:hypothetical protein
MCELSVGIGFDSLARFLLENQGSVFPINTLF